MLIATDPNTPLNDADHVGAFNLLGISLIVRQNHVKKYKVLNAIKDKRKRELLSKTSASRLKEMEVRSKGTLSFYSKS